MSLIVLTPKRTVLVLNHVIWAIKREYRSRCSSWALDEKKRTGQDRKKVTKGLYFTYLWRSPHWSNVHEKLFSRSCSRHNHVCQVSIWNFQGLRFYRDRIFHFPIDFWMSLTTAQRYCTACDNDQWCHSSDMSACSILTPVCTWWV